MNASSCVALTSGCANRSVGASAMACMVIHCRAVPEGCPSESTIDAFAAGQLHDLDRQDIASHVASCSRCATRIGQVVAQVSLNSPTQFDSPAATRRRVTGPSNPTVSVNDDGTQDTIVS